MAVEDGVSNAKFTLDSQLRDETREDLSPEDVAWVDSCLIKESENSDSSWDSVKEALLEVLNSEPGLYNFLESQNNKIPEENDVEMVTRSDRVESDQSLVMEDDESEDIPRNLFNLISFKEEADSIGDSFTAEGVDDLQSMAFVGDPFLPSYTKELEETQTTGSKSDPSFTVDEIESSSDDIFRVWDLNVSAEENELGVQLKNILEGSDLESEPSLDNVIDAIAKISLSQDSRS